MDNHQNDDNGPNIQDVKVCLETAFPGVVFKLKYGIGTFQAEGSFDEYELRVILSGSRKEGRPFHIRLLQKADRVRRSIVDVHTTSPEEAEKAIKRARAYVLGIVLSLQGALYPKKAPRTDSLDSLMNSGLDNLD